MSRFLSLSRPLNRLAVAHRTRNIHLSPLLKNNGRSRGGLTNILAGEVPPPVQVKSVSSAGIHLQDGLLLSSSCIFLEGKVFLWDVPPTLWQGWGKERFELFELVVPKPEILLLGTGETVSPPPALLRQYLGSLGIQIEVMNTWNACTTYNLLAEEGRRVAAALLPFTPRPWKGQ